MRKRYRVLLLAAIVAAVVVPVGFALEAPPVVANAQVAVVALPAPLSGPTADAAKLFGAGTLLLGLAAAVRKAS